MASLHTTLQSSLQINHFEIILGINKPQQQFLLHINHLEILHVLVLWLLKVIYITISTSMSVCTSVHTVKENECHTADFPVSRFGLYSPNHLS